VYGRPASLRACAHSGGGAHSGAVVDAAANTRAEAAAAALLETLHGRTKHGVPLRPLRAAPPEGTGAGAVDAAPPPWCGEKVANRDIRVWRGATENGP
jgi:hypothetical protein